MSTNDLAAAAAGDGVLQTTAPIYLLPPVRQILSPPPVFQQVQQQVHKLPVENYGGLNHLSLHPQGYKKARIDGWLVLVKVIVPTAIFALTTAVLSFSLRFYLWWCAWLAALAFSLPSFYTLFLASKHFKANPTSSHGRWLRVLCVACFAAWVAGLVMGEVIYLRYMRRYYEMTGLNYYPVVDPSLSGQSHIDGGRFMFQEGSRVETSRAMGVKVSGVYCVAPIVNPTFTLSDGAKQSEWDYWAVGENCCSPVQPQEQWHCGEVDNHRARGAMRLMSDAARPFYRMAVQEAESTYHIKAKHPIFLEWVMDPAAKMASWREDGTRLYWEAFFAVLAFMAFFAVSASFYFTKAFSTSHGCRGVGVFKYIATLDPDEYEEHVGITKYAQL